MLLLLGAVSIVLVVSFLCSIAESVLLSISRPQVEGMIQKGRRSGRLMAKFKDNIDVPIAAILILNTAAHTIGASVAGASYTGVFSAETLWLFSIVFTIAVLLLTEIIPKTLGVSYAASLASPVAYGLAWLTRILRPVVAVTEKLSKSLRRDEKLPVTSTEEIRLLASLGRSEGVVGSRTAGMIVGATQLRRLSAASVMLPRGGVRFLHANMTRSEVEKNIRRWGHSRFPFSTSAALDDASSIVLVKDLLYWLQDHEDGEIDWPAIGREPLIVPESMPVPGLLRTFQLGHQHLALVVDEYGGVSGIVTLEDVIEEVFGDIEDESDVPATEMRERYDGTLVLRGAVDMRKVSARLGVHWDVGSRITTIGGLVVETLERIPAIGDFIDWKGFRVTVENADERQVKTVSIRPLRKQAARDEAETAGS